MVEYAIKEINKNDVIAIVKSIIPKDELDGIEFDDSGLVINVIPHRLMRLNGGSGISHLKGVPLCNYSKDGLGLIYGLRNATDALSCDDYVNIVETVYSMHEKVISALGRYFGLNLVPFTCLMGKRLNEVHGELEHSDWLEVEPNSFWVMAARKQLPATTGSIPLEKDVRDKIVFK